MSNNSDLVKLYSGKILALAADIPLTDRLTAPHATIKQRAPLCGSTVTVDVCVTDGKISAFGQDVKACALGQASASVMAQSVIGCSLDQIKTAREQLEKMLTTDAPAPVAPFDGLQVLRPAREYKNRHASILLALTATEKAMQQIVNESAA